MAPGELGLGRAYVCGLLDVDDLPSELLEEGMFRAARSARTASADPSGTCSRFPKASFAPAGVHSFVRRDEAVRIITHVRIVE